VRVRTRLALTVAATGLLTAALVIGAVLYGYQRFEREINYRRSSEFLTRVVGMYDNLLDLHERDPAHVTALLSNLVFLEPDARLYLLDADGQVLASTGQRAPGAGYRVAIEPVRQAAAGVGVPYVMGDDPERGRADAVVAARPLSRATIRPGPAVAGYLYLFSPPGRLPAAAGPAVQAGFGLPALGLILGIVALSTLLSAWVIATVTMPLRRLTDAVAGLSPASLEGSAGAELPASVLGARDEFGQLAGAFRLLLGRVREQWAALRRLDAFRREGVSNLSHDLRSPLTATVACLDTLETRWAGDPARAADRKLLAVALRNSHNAARLVQALGDLARLDEPAFELRLQTVDLRELIDDVQLRFAERARSTGVTLASVVPDAADAGDSAVETGAAGPVPATVDIELIERALANLLDNALKFCRPGDAITLAAVPPSTAGGMIEITVADTGPGIAEHHLPQLFDRFYQARQGTAPATGEGGKGLGLAIVKRIAELHGGAVEVHSARGSGTRVCLRIAALK
jgi:signal transduction histidine kinase